MFKTYFTIHLNVRNIRFYLALFLLLFSFVLLPQQVYADSDVERVIIISIDSMNNDFIFNDYENPDFQLTPNIGHLLKNGAVFTDAEAVMPTKTQVNHVTIVTGCYADKIGIAGNYVYDRNKTGVLFFQKYIQPWKKPELMKADTIFKAMERENPSYTSAIVAGKNYVGRPIWADIQVAPGYLSKTSERLGAKKFPEVQFWDAPDEWTMDNVLLILEKADPDIMLINLAFLDPAQHIFGHGSLEAWAAISWADYQLGRLLEYLTDSGKLSSTLLVVTGDHGQSNVWEPINVGNILKTNGVNVDVAADGPFAHIYLKDMKDLEKAVKILEGMDAVDGVWYGESLDEIHIRTPYTGDIAISFRPPYEGFYHFQEPFLGAHGGLQQRFVPLIFFGPNVRRGLIMENASLTDIVPTVCEIAGYPVPEDSQGKVLPVIDRSQSVSPGVTVQFVTYVRYKVSYITLIFYSLSVLILIPALAIHKKYGYPWIDISSDRISNIVPSLLLTTSVVLAMISSIFSYIVNLYSLPGVQPDSFLVSMHYSILGSYFVSISLSLIIFWYTPFGIQMLRQKISKISKPIRTIPISMIFLIISQLIFTSIHMLIHIPYDITFHVYFALFFGGLGVSYLFRVIMINRYIEANRRGIIIWTAISGVMNGFFWFYLLMFIMFPNYLYEMGIAAII
jgi:predicted AlkP superfamily pyrophosphatase or phosphodiesterase